VLANIISWDFEWEFTKYQSKLPKTGDVRMEINECFFEERKSWFPWLHYEEKDLDKHLPKPVWIHSNCPLYHWIAKNPIYHKRIIELGLVPKQAKPEEYSFFIGASLSNMFFSKIQNVFQQEADRLSLEWRKDPQTFLIGIAIRIGAKFRGGDTPHIYLTDSEIAAMWRCAKNMAKPGMNNKFFVMSDTPQIMAQARQQFGSQLLEVSGEIQHIWFANSQQQQMKSVIEHHLFGECDEIIITAESTFGGTAMLRTGKLGVYPSGDKCVVIEPSKSPTARGQILW